MEGLERYGKPVLRIGMSLVFFYFGFQQLIDTDNWTGFVPSGLFSGVPVETVVVVNGFLELGLGAFLILGLFTRTVSIILSMHLFAISLSLGLTPLGIRDFGLAVATLAVFFNGADWLSIDAKMNKPDATIDSS